MRERIEGGPPRDVYERHWRASAYLQQYYSGDPSSDEVANARFACRELRSLGRRFSSALEFGCGPTVHHLVNWMGYVDRVRMTDFLPENLVEVRRWLEVDSEAFDWDPWLRGMVAAEDGAPAGPALEAEVALRKRQMRSSVTSVGTGDVRCENPLGDGETFDLVGSWYCLECLGGSRDEWRDYLANLLRLLKPGGVLLLGALRRASEYQVLDRAFPVTPVDERDFAEVLPSLGVDPGELRIEAVQTPEFTSQGFDGICCVRGVKTIPRA